jgi:hypothetical protein
MHSLRAILGFKEDGLVRICSWCADKAEAELWCRREQLSMTHTICPECQVRFMAESRLEEAALLIGTESPR